MEPIQRNRAWSIRHLEVLVLSMTLLATVYMSWLVLQQSKDHYRLERTASFVARFNSTEMVSLREDVDRWLASKEPPEVLFKRSQSPPVASGQVKDQAITQAAAAMEQFSRLRTLTNYFQEFGAATKFGMLDDRYAHNLLGNVCVRYGEELGPFIEFMRSQRNRPGVYAEVDWLRNRMRELDAADGVRSDATKPPVAPVK